MEQNVTNHKFTVKEHTGGLDAYKRVKNGIRKETLALAEIRINEMKTENEKKDITQEI
jgi:hypothetical protein